MRDLFVSLDSRKADGYPWLPRPASGDPDQSLRKPLPHRKTLDRVGIGTRHVVVVELWLHDLHLRLPMAHPPHVPEAPRRGSVVSPGGDHARAVRSPDQDRALTTRLSARHSASRRARPEGFLRSTVPVAAARVPEDAGAPEYHGLVQVP